MSTLRSGTNTMARLNSRCKSNAMLRPRIVPDSLRVSSKLNNRSFADIYILLNGWEKKNNNRVKNSK